MPETVSLAEKRKSLNLSQEQLSALLGVTQGTVSRNETASDPDRRYVLALDALALRHANGENLAAAADAEITSRGKAAA